MSKVKLDWALFEKAAAAVKQAQDPPAPRTRPKQEGLGTGDLSAEERANFSRNLPESDPAAEARRLWQTGTSPPVSPQQRDINRRVGAGRTTRDHVVAPPSGSTAGTITDADRNSIPLGAASAMLGSLFWKDYVNREKAKSMWGDKVEIGGTDVRGTSNNPYLGDASTFRAYKNLPKPQWYDPTSWSGPFQFVPENLSTGVRGPNRAD